MSIKLDWEVESEGGWAEIGEDAAALAARQRAAKRARTIVAVLLGAGVLIGGAIGFRLYTADQQARADLRATVTAEAAAIRIGDSNAYLDIQENVGSWRQMQSDRFSQYQSQGERVKANGEIVKLDIDGGKGRVVVQEKVDDKPYNMVWFYQHNDEGWKHVPPEVAYWGSPHELAGTHYSFAYWDEDTAFVKQLQDRLEAWWELACRLTDCHNGSVIAPQTLKVRVEPDPLLQLGWAAYDPHTLRIPSPLLGRVPADGSMDPALEQALAGYIAQYWDAQLNSQTAPNNADDVAWAHDEFRTWLTSSFVPGAPHAPLLGPLADMSGTPAVLTLVGQVQQGQEMTSALQSITGKDIGDLPVQWDRYLTYRLRGEATLMGNNHQNEALVLYGDPGQPNSDMLVSMMVTLQGVDPGTINVTTARRFGRILWAETHYRQQLAAGENGTVSVESLVTNKPFKLIDGRWVHTLADSTDFGDPVEERGQHVMLHYSTIDKPSVEGLLTDLDQQYMTIVTDLGLPDLPPVDVEISPSITNSGFALTPPSGYPQETPAGIALWVGSPYSATYPEDQTQPLALRKLLTRDMVQQMTEFALHNNPEAGSQRGTALAQAIARWELRHLGLVDEDVATRATGASAPGSLDELWVASQDLQPGHGTAVAADVLVDMLVEKQGEAVIPALVKNLATAATIDDWTFQSAGVHALDLEPSWKLRLRAALPGGLEGVK